MLSVGFSSVGKSKYFDKNSKRFKNGCFVYDAIKITISFVDGNVVMNLLPTVHVLTSNGNELDRFEYQNIVNSEMSTLYNKQMNERKYTGTAANDNPGKQIPSQHICP